jgi:hypothetical protein
MRQSKVLFRTLAKEVRPQSRFDSSRQMRRKKARNPQSSLRVGRLLLAACSIGCENR